MSLLFIDPDRLWQDIMALGRITDPEQPWTRRSFTARYDEGRHWVSQQMSAAGLDVSIDAAGNLVGRRESEQANAPAIVIGSHTDTVPNGGRFDGIAGVCAGIEIARTLRDHGYRNTHPIEVIDFLAEEPSEFGHSCIGSRGLAGALMPDMLASRHRDGRLLSEAIAASGGVPSRLIGALRDDIAAYFELHIEQARVLESASVSVGIVTSIAGVTRAAIAFEGAADHAGATPLGHRADALLAASRTIVRTREEAERVASGSPAYFVATIGKIDVKPNAANVVPGRAELVVDVRSEDPCLTERFFAALDQATTAIANDNGVKRCQSFRALRLPSATLHCETRSIGPHALWA